LEPVSGLGGSLEGPGEYAGAPRAAENIYFRMCLCSTVLRSQCLDDSVIDALVVHSRGEMDMSFVVAVPDLVEVAAQDLAGIRSALDEVAEAIAAPTTGLPPAAADEVSTAIAALFGNFGKEFQAVNAQAAAFHNAFVNTMTGGAAAYVEAEVANGAALLFGGGSLTAELGAALSGFGAAINASVSAGLNASLGLGGALETFLGAGLSGVALQTGGFLLSGIGNGLVQTGNAIVQAGLALESSGAALSSMGAQLIAQANGALSALLNANFGLNITATLSAGLPPFPSINLTLPGLPSFVLPALPGLPPITVPSLPGLPNLGADINAALSAMLNLSLPPFPPINLTLPGLPSFVLPALPGLPPITLPNLGADINAALQTGETLAANFFASLPGLPALTLPNLMLSINAALSGSLNAALQGLGQVGVTLAAGLSGGLTGLINSGAILGGSLGGGLLGLAQTGDAIATIWTNTTQAVADQIAGALSATVGVGFPGLFHAGESFAVGLEDAANGLVQTGGTVVTSVEAALSDLGLSLQAALDASLGIGVAA
jgi:hypothetical protein